MKNSTKNQVEGKLHEEKGKLKESAGMLTEDKKLDGEGRVEQ